MHQTNDQKALDFVSFRTVLGYAAFCRSKNGICRLAFGHPRKSEAEAELSKFANKQNAHLRNRLKDDPIAQRLTEFAKGEFDSFDDVIVDHPQLSEFNRRVINHCRLIPYGKTISYGELAKKAGSPLAARAVGNVMRNNCVPLIVPCHRVVASGGKLGGFSAPSGLDLKRRLLAIESKLLQT